MFARLFAVASLAALAVAGPAPLAVRDQCNTGTLSCCNSVHQASDASSLLSAFNLADVMAGVTGMIGVGCTPINVIGSSGSQCKQQPVCCSDNTYNGLINIGCSPIDIGA